MGSQISNRILRKLGSETLNNKAAAKSLSLDLLEIEKANDLVKK